MITDLQKTQIIALIEREKEALKSYSKVAVKCIVAPATITNSMLKPENHHLVNDRMWLQVGKALGYKFSGTGWQVVETNNYRTMKAILNLAQSDSMFMAVSEKAGSGKSASIAKFKEEDQTNTVFNIICEEWSRRVFLTKLAQSLGVDLSQKSYHPVEWLSTRIIGTLKQFTVSGRPLIILDEADKLKPSALRWLIHFYNNLEDECGLLICGTENLKKEIKRGVQKAIKGYDELDSRLGRQFIHLPGATFQDLTEICSANGITQEATILKIWAECEPVEKLNGQKAYVRYIEDFRRIKRCVKRETKLPFLNNN